MCARIVLEPEGRILTSPPHCPTPNPRRCSATYRLSRESNSMKIGELRPVAKMSMKAPDEVYRRIVPGGFPLGRERWSGLRLVAVQSLRPQRFTGAGGLFAAR